MDPATLSAIGIGLGSVGSLFQGDPLKKLRKLAQSEMWRTKGQLEQGISESDIARLGPSSARAALPAINLALGRGSAKFGSRSGLTLGAGVSAAANSVAPQIAELLAKRLGVKQENLRAILQAMAQLSTAGK